MIDSHFFAVGAAVRSTLADDGDFADLLRAFADTIPQKREAVRALHREGAVDQLRVWAHQLKGAGGGYGFPGLTEAATELEGACDAHDADRINQAVEYLIDYLNRIEA